MIYVVIDKALVDLDKINIKGESLFLGKTGEMLDSVAPYLCQIELPADSFISLISNPPHERWGIILKSDLDFKSIHHHLRKFLYVKTEQGKKLYFRFYDPSVLPTFLKTSDENQLTEFFGKIDGFVCTDIENTLTSYWLKEKKLMSDTLSLGNFIESNSKG